MIKCHICQKDLPEIGELPPELEGLAIICDVCTDNLMNLGTEFPGWNEQPGGMTPEEIEEYERQGMR